MLAMAVNDNALSQMPRGALWFFASRLAPTGCKRLLEMIGPLDPADHLSTDQLTSPL
jgi:hypothetical protein